MNTMSNTRKNKCLVLGGGFIGEKLLNKLLDHGHHVTLFDIHEYPYFSKYLNYEFEFVKGDFSHIGECFDSFESFDVIYHLISTTIPNTSNEDPVFDVNSNLVSTLNLLNILKNESVPPRIIYVSSGGTVYGEPEYLPIDEKHPTNPICSYGIVKLAIEKYLSLYERLYGVKYTVVRVSNPYGDYIKKGVMQGLIPIIINKIINDEVITVWGDGLNARDYIYIDDLIDALEKTMYYSGSMRVFNIGTGVARTINELIQIAAYIANKEPKVKYVDERGFDVKINCMSIKAAKNELGWRPVTSLEQGVEMTWKSITSGY